MAGSSESYHEPYDLLSGQAKNYHRALTSLQEELEAVDWYRQRAEATEDAELRDILLHNMREEMEHASMLLEWLRRRDHDLDAILRTYLFTREAITQIEEQSEREVTLPAATGTEPPPPLTVGAMKRG